MNIINPETNKPFKTQRPWAEVVKLRHQIIDRLAKRQYGPQAKYDAAQTTSQNELHWNQIDDLSPNSANTLAVRKVLRSRSRYEVANNGYLKGILLTIANDFIGSGPTLQITDTRFTAAQRERIERQWSRRVKRINLRRKLRQLRFARSSDGESFSVMFQNRKLKHPVKVDHKIIECDQVSNYSSYQSFKQKSVNEIDGIRFSATTGEPMEYFVLQQHPGETQVFSADPLAGSWFPADTIIHWFRRDRPWLRGIPETTPTLPLWALLRRYTLAVVQNAEIAADFTVLLKSMQQPYSAGFSLSSGEPTEEDPDDWFSSFPIDRGLMTVLPSSYEMSQLDPKQPVTVYDDFVNALVQEACRPLLIPRNAALGNSGGYNMSSGTLDRQMYRMSITEDRMDCESEVLEKDFMQWWNEALLVADYFEDEAASDSIASTVFRFRSIKEEGPDHVYRWDEVPEHTDPVKVATAINLLYQGGHISDTDIQEGRFNRRVEDHYRNLQAQQEARRQFAPEQQTSEATDNA